MKTPAFTLITFDDLDHVSGGMKWQDLPQSTNIEDRRPQSDGGPVPDAEWQKEQEQLQQEQEQQDQQDQQDDPNDGGGNDAGGTDGDGGGSDGGGSDGSVATADLGPGHPPSGCGCRVGATELPGEATTLLFALGLIAMISRLWRGRA